MRTIFLLRHGHFAEDTLSLIGCAQISFAAERFMEVWDRVSIAAWHAPALRVVQTAALFQRITGILSTKHELLNINTFHDEGARNAFAEIACEHLVPNIILIGHDENRRHMEAIVRIEFGDERKSSRMPQGGLLRYTREGGYELL